MHNNIAKPPASNATTQTRTRHEKTTDTPKDEEDPALTKLLTELRTVKEMDVFFAESDDIVSRATQGSYRHS